MTDASTGGQAGDGTTAAMRDGFGRRIEYLRISVTDKCNLRCVYCMPLHGLPWLKRSDLLSYEEIAAIVRHHGPMGLRRLGSRAASPGSPGCHPPHRHALRHSRYR
jgi:MoaA/NifB/PqqE/SkfB family radical SAM enzyme